MSIQESRAEKFLWKIAKIILIIFVVGVLGYCLIIGCTLAYFGISMGIDGYKIEQAVHRDCSENVHNSQLDLGDWFGAVRGSFQSDSGKQITLECRPTDDGDWTCKCL